MGLPSRLTSTGSGWRTQFQHLGTTHYQVCNLYVPIVTRQRLSDTESIDRGLENPKLCRSDKKYLHLTPSPKCSMERFGSCTTYTQSASVGGKVFFNLSGKNAFVNEQGTSTEWLHLVELLIATSKAQDNWFPDQKMGVPLCFAFYTRQRFSRKEKTSRNISQIFLVLTFC